MSGNENIGETTKTQQSALVQETTFLYRQGQFVRRLLPFHPRQKVGKKNRGVFVRT